MISSSNLIDMRYLIQSGNESEERSESSDAGEFNLNTLLRVYKEAILVGDRKIVVAVEARVEAIENKSSDLADKVSTLTEEVKSGKQKLVRLQADFDNFRKRSEKERLSVRSNAQGEVIESLLPMVDNFERAKQILKPETDMEKKIDASYQGIYKQFVEIMRSLRVSAVPTVGKPFDPLVSGFCKDICTYRFSVVFEYMAIRLMFIFRCSVGSSSKRCSFIYYI